MSKTRGRIKIAAAALFGVALLRSEAAQCADRADQLVSEGNDLAAKGKGPEACTKYRQALSLVPDGIGVNMYVARCFVDEGRPKSAWERFRKAEQSASMQASAPGLKENDKNALLARADLARTFEKAVDGAIPRLEIQLTDSSLADQWILCDGATVPASDYGHPIRLDPGTHTIESGANGHPKWQKVITLSSGEKISVLVPDLRALYYLNVQVPNSYPSLKIFENGRLLSGVDLDQPREVPAGDYEIKADAPGREHFRQIVTLGPNNQEKTVVVEMAVPGNLGGAQKAGLVFLSIGATLSLTSLLTGGLALQSWQAANDQCRNHPCLPAGTAAGVQANQLAAATNTLLITGLALHGLSCLFLGFGTREPVTPKPASAAVQISIGLGGIVGQF